MCMDHHMTSTKTCLRAWAETQIMIHVECWLQIKLYFGGGPIEY